MPFVKGQSGNPLGASITKKRPSKLIQERLRRLDKLFVRELRNAMQSPDARTKLEALRLFALYRWGKPTEHQPGGKATAALPINVPDWARKHLGNVFATSAPSNDDKSDNNTSDPIDDPFN